MTTGLRYLWNDVKDITYFVYCVDWENFKRREPKTREWKEEDWQGRDNKTLLEKESYEEFTQGVVRRIYTREEKVRC